MKISVILAHPDPGTLNHAIARTAVEWLEHKGYQVFFHDLYWENFDPLLIINEIPSDAPVPQLIKDHCDEIKERIRRPA